MTWTLVSTANFERGLRKLSALDLRRAQRILEEITSDPYSFKELRGRFRDLRSARFGGHRVIYTINEDRKEIVLLSAEARASVYER